MLDVEKSSFLLCILHTTAIMAMHKMLDTVKNTLILFTSTPPFFSNSILILLLYSFILKVYHYYITIFISKITIFKIKVHAIIITLPILYLFFIPILLFPYKTLIVKCFTSISSNVSLIYSAIRVVIEQYQRICLSH